MPHRTRNCIITCTNELVIYCAVTALLHGGEGFPGRVAFTCHTIGLISVLSFQGPLAKHSKQDGGQKK